MLILRIEASKNNKRAHVRNLEWNKMNEDAGFSVVSLDDALGSVAVLKSMVDAYFQFTLKCIG